MLRHAVGCGVYVCTSEEWSVLEINVWGSLAHVSESYSNDKMILKSTEDREGIMLSEINQTEKDKYPIISAIWGI